MAWTVLVSPFVLQFQLDEDALLIRVFIRCQEQEVQRLNLLKMGR
jgi:hypothetical protein